MSDERLKLAIALAKGGEKKEAKELLEVYVRERPTNEIAWLC